MMESNKPSNSKQQEIQESAGASNANEEEEEVVPNELDVDLFATNCSSDVSGSGQSKNKNDLDSSNKSPDLVNQLEEFRQQWHSELKTPSDTNSEIQSDQQDDNIDPENIQETAKRLYMKGVELEERRMLMEAIYYYKRAMHLVPDIEMQLAPLFTSSPRERVRQDSENSLEGSEIEENLVSHFENMCVEEKALCSPAYEQRATHISTLPVELLMYILQWVVSPSLDVRSLESISRVCRGFFLCTRDEQIWKLACDKVWGPNVGQTKRYGGSWRRMLIERARPLYDGCYISRMSYIRQGEQSMDHFYRPCHVVQYYRYLRFFPDGTVVMLVSPEEPSQSLAKLRHSSSSATGLLIGGYKLLDSRVTCVMRRVKTEQNNTVYRYKRQRRQAANQNEAKISYYLDLDIGPAGKRQNAKLVWKRYSSSTLYKSTGEESVSDFELGKNTFPPLVFSHVTSYSTASTQPLT